MTLMPPVSPRRATASLAALLCLSLAGCAPLPDIAAQTNTMPGVPPVLVPIDGILAQADAVGSGASAIGSVSARADRLRTRAEGLRRQ